MKNEIVNASLSTDVQIPQRDPRSRRGRNDKDVEIFRDGQIHEGMLSQVLVGDCFCVADKPEVWFKCVAPIRASTWNRSEDSFANPTFSLAGIQVLQARPTVERQPAMLESMTTKQQVKDHARLLGYDDDGVQDVDFTE